MSDNFFQSFDARDWAKAFYKRFPMIDEGTMIGWFANAIMRGYDHRASESTPPPGDGGLRRYPVEIRLEELEDILARVTDAFDSEHESYVAVLGGRHPETCQTCNLLVEAKEAIASFGTRPAQTEPLP